MNIKSLPTASIVALLFIITYCAKTSFPLSMVNELNNEEKWAMTKKLENNLENNLPDYINEIITSNKLIPWKLIYYCNNELFSSISIAYVSENELFKNNLIIGHEEGFDFITIYPNLLNNDLYLEKRAEAFFSIITGEFLEFKIKVDGNWITKKKRIKI